MFGIKLILFGVIMTVYYSHFKPGAKAAVGPDPVKEFVNNKWILAAAGTTGVLPPRDYCVHITVADNNDTSDCVYLALNHTPTNYKNFQIHGINEMNITKIRTIGPVLPYLKHKEKILNIKKAHSYFSVACWHPRNHRMQHYKYVIHFEDVENPNTNHLMLTGTDTRSPHPEIQNAILTKTKIKKADLMKMIDKYNKDTYRYFEDYNEHLPPLEIKCANDYDEKNPNEPLNLKTTTIAKRTTDKYFTSYYFNSSFKCRIRKTP